MLALPKRYLGRPQLGRLVTYVVHPELLVEAGQSGDLRIDPSCKLRLVLDREVMELDEDQRQGGEPLLAIHHVNASIHDVRYIRVEVVPGVVRRDRLLPRIEIPLGFVLRISPNVNIRNGAS